jgi:DNA polymerase (family 10)
VTILDPPGNGDIALQLAELATLMKLEDGSAQSFRVRAYEKAVDGLRAMTSPAADSSAAQLQEIEGVGKSTALMIREYVDAGHIERLDALRKKYPPALVELTRVPGLGPKTVLLVRDELGVESVEQLREALDAQQLRTLAGMGARSEEKIARAVERLGLGKGERRTPIIEALPIARQLIATLGGLPQVRHIDYCGSLRRFADAIGDIDILVASNDPALVMETFVGLPMVADVLGHGETKSAVVTIGGMQVDLRVVKPAQYGAALLYFTGSKAHNIELRQRALAAGWTLNEYELSDSETGDVVASRTEQAIYRALGLAYVAPEMREGLGEVTAAADGKLPRLVDVDDLRGDLHVHSTWSGDGRSSLEAMIATAAGRGLEYIAITEHAEDLAINGLSRAEVLEERAVLEDLRPGYPNLTILHGAELNIGADGTLDYDQDFLAGFDFCVASVHSHFDLPVADQTERLVRAISNPAVNVIGHLTGRQIGRRPGIELDIEPVLDALAGSGTGLEINSHLDRLDASADVLRRGRAYPDLSYVISTDAHHVTELDNSRWGVHESHRGWVDKRRVANTWPRKRFLGWVAAKRNT